MALNETALFAVLACSACSTLGANSKPAPIEDLLPEGARKGYVEFEPSRWSLSPDPRFFTLLDARTGVPQPPRLLSEAVRVAKRPGMYAYEATWDTHRSCPQDPSTPHGLCGRTSARFSVPVFEGHTTRVRLEGTFGPTKSVDRKTTETELGLKAIVAVPREASARSWQEDFEGWPRPTTGMGRCAMQPAGYSVKVLRPDEAIACGIDTESSPLEGLKEGRVEVEVLRDGGQPGLALLWGEGTGPLRALRVSPSGHATVELVEVRWAKSVAEQLEKPIWSSSEISDSEVTHETPAIDRLVKLTILRQGEKTAYEVNGVRIAERKDAAPMSRIGVLVHGEGAVLFKTLTSRSSTTQEPLPK